MRVASKRDFAHGEGGKALIGPLVLSLVKIILFRITNKGNSGSFSKTIFRIRVTVAAVFEVASTIQIAVAGITGSKSSIDVVW